MNKIKGSTKKVEVSASPEELGTYESSINIHFFRKIFSDALGPAKLLPLPLSYGRVFIPIKSRKTIGVNDGSFAYIDIKYIKEVIKEERSLIKLKCGICIACLETAKTVKNRIRSGKLMEERLLSILMEDRMQKPHMRGIHQYQYKIATKDDINTLVQEIMKLRDIIEKV